MKGIAGKPNAPRIAIVVGGLGIGASGNLRRARQAAGTGDTRLRALWQQSPEFAARARAEGHEVLLQVPMEPFDYPDNDPGPQTLLTSLEASQNIDRLHWLMSRFQGYVGIANYMGARFTVVRAGAGAGAARGQQARPDLPRRRLLAAQPREPDRRRQQSHLRQGDAVLDAVPTAADIDRALGRLETLARERGTAVGMASALPVSIERIANWAKTAESPRPAAGADQRGGETAGRRHAQDDREQTIAGLTFAVICPL